jgi:hypothetical protein
MYRSDPVNEEKGDRRFGGCPFAHPGADILTNMQATAKQNNITGTDKSYFVTVQSQAKFQKQV